MTLRPGSEADTTMCQTCTVVLEEYGSLESVAPWLCTCAQPEQSCERAGEAVTAQENIYGCRCPVWTSKYSGRTIVYCRCD